MSGRSICDELNKKGESEWMKAIMLQCEPNNIQEFSPGLYLITIPVCKILNVKKRFSSITNWSQVSK